MRTSLGDRRHIVTVQTPSVAIPDGDGGSVQTWAYASPQTWHCSIDPATEQDLQRVTAGTVITTASHVMKGRYHAQITTATRLVYRGVVYQVAGVADPELRQIETIVIAIELVGAVLLMDAELAQADLFQDGLVQEGFV